MIASAVRWSLLSLISIAALVACGGSSPPIAPFPPSGFSVRPDITVPLCNHGRGFAISGRLGGDNLASAALADGSTLFAFTAIYPGGRGIVLRSVTRACTPNSAFGANGVERISIPAFKRPHVGGTYMPAGGIWIEAIAPRQGGGATIAGSYGGVWVVGAVTAHGQVDRRFGNRGWTLMPFSGGVTAVVQETSGRIVVAGDNGGGGCCTLNWAAALSERGRLDMTFGRRGRAELPTGEDSGVRSLALEPNGDILAEVAYGNMGCWGIGLAMLTPAGNPVPQFESRLARFWRGFGFGTFAGDVFTNGNGFIVVGTGQTTCADPGITYDHPPPRPYGLIARFLADGSLVGRIAHFRSPLLEFSAFRRGPETLLFTFPYTDSTVVRGTARRVDGSVDTRFENHGHAVIHTPWKGREAAIETMVSISSFGHEIDVVAWRLEGNALQLVRLGI